ncbi:MAG: DUF5063 domain-containing protein [Paludibacteraceae bacterium]|nr:DUF5063 domain-containing protein [Paludibacteraceae bacterium]MBR5972262.1 DUF5063 domain-containing protein [Paludibacteraceae bacterium]
MIDKEAYPQHPVYDKNTIEFVTVAAEYCAFLESCRRYNSKSFFDKSVKLLSLLYLKTSLLPNLEDSSFSDLQQFVTEASYENLRQNITCLTGQYDEYLEVFQEDMQYSDTPIVAYISEGLADVYQDLKDMISNFQSADIQIMNDALRDCKDNFQAYWGQKALNTLRAMHNVLYADIDWDDNEQSISDFNDSDFETNINKEEIDFFND